MIDFVKLIKEYVRQLDYDEKEIAIKAVNELSEQGFSSKWIYFAVMKIDSKGGFLEYKNLLFYKPFQEEITAKINRISKDYLYKKEDYKKFNELEWALKFDELSDKDRQELEDFIERSVYDYTDEELDYFYNKFCLLGILKQCLKYF